ncbi:MAG: flagellar motor protein MotB [Bdellovibrionales bacterium]
MADQNQPIIIIKKKKRGGHEGHHGGAWKVAYADFVTAMMSFFLLLWLLNVTTAEQRRGIADYFSPASISKSESGAGGVFGGLSIAVDHGASMSASSSAAGQEASIPTAGKGEEGEAEVSGTGKSGQDKTGEDASSEKKTATALLNLSRDEQAMAEAMKLEEDVFKKAEEALKLAIRSSPELKEFANQILIDRTSEGLRIQITDRDKLSMFPSGNATPYERGRDLMLLIGKVLARLPNNVSITGHTDANPFSTNSRRDNWSLSTERANVTRETIMNAGVAEYRIMRVSGLADREPLVMDDPKNPRNRRISIVLIRNSKPFSAPEALSQKP